MRVVAYTYVRNEEDIIEESVENMLAQGCDVYILDNWSTDRTREIVFGLQRRYMGRVFLERFPPYAPPRWFELNSLLRRIEQIHPILAPDWGVLFGADELMESPRPYVPLSEYLGFVVEAGYTAVPAVEAVFHPVDDGWRPGMSMREYFRYWAPGNQHNVRAWRAQEFRFLDGGHDVGFDGYKFWTGERIILRHYPYRNQEQATRKVFEERLPRYSPEERAIGWHSHLDALQPGHNFIRSPDGLWEYNPDTFYGEVQRLWRTF